jgi:hypothetical protein
MCIDDGSEEYKSCVKDLDNYFASPEGISSLSREVERRKNARLPELRRFLEKWSRVFPGLYLEQEEGYYVLGDKRFDNHFEDVNRIEPFKLREMVPGKGYWPRSYGALIENMNDLARLKDDD